jgi:hypothetical protein
MRSNHEEQQDRQVALIWKELKHPGILSLEGIALFQHQMHSDPCDRPYAFITHRPAEGNILNFLARHPDVNRIALVRCWKHLLQDLVLSRSRC